MGKIVRNREVYSGTYDSATSVNYNNAASGLNARTVQEAVDEVQGNVDALSESLMINRNVGRTDITVVNASDKFTLENNSYYMVVNGICYFQIIFTINSSISSSEGYSPFSLPASAFGNYLYFYSQNGAVLRISNNGGVRVNTSVSEAISKSHCIIGSYPII